MQELNYNDRLKQLSLRQLERRRMRSNLVEIFKIVNRKYDINPELEMWAKAQRDGRPVEYRWRPVLNATVWLCSNAAKTRNLLKFAGVPQTNETISAASGPKFTIL